MRDYHAYFEANHFYHVYNRGNNKNNLFSSAENYTFFLKKWSEYLDDFTEVFAYCLIPNHFHFLIRVKSEKGLKIKSKNVDNINDLLAERFRRLFSSYTLSFNKYNNRTGSLFQKRFKRIKIDSNRYLLLLIHYIHHNPIHHNLIQDYSQWPFSSYSAIIGQSPTKVKRDEVLKLFGGKQQFLQYHKEMRNYKEIRHLLID